MYKVACFLCLLVLNFERAVAQNAEDSVKAVITTLFSAMKSGDAASLQTVFSDSALLQSVARTPEGKILVRNESIKDFIAFIGKQTAGAADERIEFETVKIEGPLASVWTPYTFYFKGKFSHCGVNSFQLVRINGNWKIQYIIDTRRKEGCLID
jgi:hypothetical protein